MENKRWATSDLHFHHKNIIKFTERGDDMFESGYVDLNDLKEYEDGDKNLITTVHTDWLIDRINSQVSSGDVVYHLGDFSFSKGAEEISKVIGRLNGSWNFILGNHDNESKLREACKGTKHKVLGHYHEISVNSLRVCLLHYPMEEWHQIHRGAWHLHGHLHGQKGHGEFSLKDMKRRMDVGLDAHPEHKLFDLSEIITDG